MGTISVASILFLLPHTYIFSILLAHVFVFVDVTMTFHEIS
jgi:hypothetical protein